MDKLRILGRMVAYDSFIKDLASRIAAILEADRADPEFVSQRKAYAMFGRANVERWRRQGKLELYKRPGKIQYRTSQLRLLQRTVQDYFDFPDDEDGR